MRLETLAVLLGSAALLASAACGGDDSENTTSMGNGGSGATGGTTSATGGMASTSSGMGAGGQGTGGSPIEGYPAGPYGPQEGLTFPQLTFHGYLSTDPAALATTETWTETYTSQDLFESGAAYALIHTSLSG
ncbi:MAG TPA: hypothetical protein ENK57_14810 [Polyangiaceae bacterium]|nr:hypothetical protein [Polyangiaceae bacterium]